MLFSFIASLGFDFISFGAQREKYRCKFTEENHFEPYEIWKYNFKRYSIPFWVFLMRISKQSFVEFLWRSLELLSLIGIFTQHYNFGLDHTFANLPKTKILMKAKQIEKYCCHDFSPRNEIKFKSKKKPLFPSNQQDLMTL